MGYDPFKHLSRERAVRGAGETEHVDFAIELGEGENRQLVIMVEIKRIGVDLARKHLRQISNYSIEAGCEWALLTNAREWQLHHVSFGKPPETKLVFSWDIIKDDVALLAERFALVSFRRVSRGSLDAIWQKFSVLSPRSLLQAMLCDECIKSIKRVVKRDSGVALAPEDIVAGVRRLLNESALGALEHIRISLSQPQKRKRRKATGNAASTVSSEEDHGVEAWDGCPKPAGAQGGDDPPNSMAPGG